MLTIRFAGPADAELIADMSRQTFYETFAAANTKENMEIFLSRQFTKEVLVKEVGAPGNIFILAYVNEVPAGYARLRENNVPPQLGSLAALEIARIYAQQSFIGQGIGKRLMEECIGIAREKNYAAVWLGVWEHNERAIRFYTQWGFKKFAEHFFTLGHDVQTDWLMKKELT